MNNTENQQELYAFFDLLQPLLSKELLKEASPPSQQLLDLAWQAAKAHHDYLWENGLYHETIIALAADSSHKNSLMTFESSSGDWNLTREEIPDDKNWQMLKFKCREELIQKFQGRQIEVLIVETLYDLGKVDRRGVAEVNIPYSLDFQQLKDVYFRKQRELTNQIAITSPLNALKENIKEGITQVKRRVLSWTAEIIESNAIYEPYELTLNAANKRGENEYKELIFAVDSNNNDFPKWVLGREIVIRNELDSTDIDKYFACILPPPEKDDDAPEKASLFITIRDDKGHEAEIELTEHESSCFFKMQEVLSDNLTEFHIDVLDK
jgi:hypothetical protein